MKGGANIRGLNTAATAWCSAAAGTSAGVVRGGREQLHRADDGHQPPLGSRRSALLIGILTALRRTALYDLAPPTKHGFARSFAGTEPECHHAAWSGKRGQKRVGEVEVWARCEATRRREPAIEHIAGGLSLEPSVSAVQGRRR